MSQDKWEQKIEQLEADITQINRLVELSERNTVKDILVKEASNLRTRLTKIKNQVEIAKAKENGSGQQVMEEKEKPFKKPTVSSLAYTALTKYSWQDEHKKAKIYFTLQNIGNECQKDQIEVEFKPNSFELRIKGYKNQNFNYCIKKTFGKIVPEQCKYLVKTNMLSVTLTKEKPGTWTQLNYKEDTFSKKNSDKDDFKDPNASLMNLMKDMYEKGDDNMKKTIAEAWTKSQDKKGGMGMGDDLKI